MKYHAPYGSTDPDAPYVDKDVPGAVRGSAVPAAAIEEPQREIVDLITRSGIVPADGNQLAQAVQSGAVNYAAGGGTAAALTVTLSPAPPALFPGLVVRVKPSLTNTAKGPTINVNGLGARPVVYTDGSPVTDGELVANCVAELVYDGTSFVLTNPWTALLRMSPRGARQTRAFTAGVALDDLAANVETMAQKITVKGTTWLDCTAYCAFRNTAASIVNMTGRIRLKNGTTVLETGDYLGCRNRDSHQTPISLRSRFDGLDASKTYTIELIVKKDADIGPVNIADPMLFALHE